MNPASGAHADDKTPAGLDTEDAAVVEVLTALRPHDALQAKFVRGEDIAQTRQFVASGSAELGFVALSPV